MTQATLASFEKTHKAVDSLLDRDTHFFINEDGMWWVSGEYKFPLAAGLCEEALKEALEVWRMFGKVMK